MIFISHAKLQVNVSMFVSGWSAESLSCESSVSVKKTLIEKKNTKKNMMNHPAVASSRYVVFNILNLLKLVLSKVLFYP